MWSVGGMAARSHSPGLRSRRRTRCSRDCPGDLRLAPADAVRLITRRFAVPYVLGLDMYLRLPEVLSGFGIAGGAMDDALVALAAVEHNATLATRDVRAKATYDTIGARTVIAG